LFMDCCQMETKCILYQDCEATPDTSSDTMKSCPTQVVHELHSSSAGFSASETSSLLSSTSTLTQMTWGVEERTSIALPG
jgi:hypothetical protein